MNLFEKIKGWFSKKQSKPESGAEEEKVFPANYDHITRKLFSDMDYRELAASAEHYVFRLNPIEYARFSQFNEDHRRCYYDTNGNYRLGAIGGGTTISFCPTGLGDIVRVSCACCGNSADLTDIDSW